MLSKQHVIIILIIMTKILAKMTRSNLVDIMVILVSKLNNTLTLDVRN